ncbi:MAG: peptidase and DD-carboxypeptidase VanY/endolysin [Bacilli bacterium]|nr:peptidase and DD-carboxypeptidase VanY/endolysin [Bacilli bacterium]
MKKTAIISLSLVLTLSLLSACGVKSPEPSSSSVSAAPQASATLTPSPAAIASQSGAIQKTPSPPDNSGTKSNTEPPGTKDSVQVVAKPESITVLVNKQFALPQNYEPTDLVYPDVPFVFKEKIEKRKMRKEAAKALEDLFAAASKASVPLSGVSAYRSYATQKALFESYVAKDGLEKARTYSAVPGTSEHATGLAIDVTGIDGKCPATNCFAGTKEAVWLEKHAPEFGFIIRYPKGKEATTGYQYEPWHIRYIGTKIAKEISESGSTLEKYLNAIPVSK